jgi:hypothetical protein
MTRRVLRGRVVGRFFLRPRLTGHMAEFCHGSRTGVINGRHRREVTLSDGPPQHAALTFCLRTH